MSSVLSLLPPPPPGKSGWPWTCDVLSPRGGDVDWPRISIVTPSYNQAEFLEETIRSVLLQGYQNLQYMVIDGGSTDGTAAILKKYSAWIDHWESTPDRGQSHAINKGLALCDGEWFNWLNSDDYLFPGALHALADCVRERPDAVVVAGRTRNLRDGALQESYGCRISGQKPSALFSLAINQPGSLLRLCAVRQTGIVEQLHYTMDLALWISLLLRGELATIDRDIAVYRYHADSKTCSGSDVFATEEYAVLHDLFSALVPSSQLSGLADARALCKAPRITFSPAKKDDAPAATRAFLDRLLVTDSLLFRALRRALKDDKRAFILFLGLLDRLRPSLATVYTDEFSTVENRALLHALQETGRITSWSAARRALRAAPSASTARSLLRLWLKP